MVDLTDVSPRIKYIATGAETEFDFGFLVYDAAHLVVLEDGVALSVDVDFTIAGLGAEAGGTITLDPTLYPSGATAGVEYTLYRDIPIETFFTFPTAGDYFAADVNKQNNLVLQILQEQERDIDRCFKLSIDSDVATIEAEDPVASAVLMYNSAGTGIINGPTAATIEDVEAVAAAAVATATADAETAQAGAEAAEAGAVAALAGMNGIYLGALASDPGSGMQAGDFYLNTTSGIARFYTGSAWIDGGTGNEFTTIELGHASDTTISRVSAGIIAVEGQELARIFSGSFTATLSGMASATTGTMNYMVVGNFVMLSLSSAITGTSNSDQMILTGLPSICFPNVTARTANVNRVQDSAGFFSGRATYDSGSPGFQFELYSVSGSLITTTSTGFTASGTKGLPAGWSMIYTK